MSQTPSVEEDSPIERTAVRLLRSSVDRSYHPEVDVDWDAPDVPGLRYVPDRYISLYGTKVFERMTEEERSGSDAWRLRPWPAGESSPKAH